MPETPLFPPRSIPVFFANDTRNERYTKWTIQEMNDTRNKLYTKRTNYTNETQTNERYMQTKRTKNMLTQTIQGLYTWF
jgi:hypothetical protein